MHDVTCGWHHHPQQLKPQLKFSSFTFMQNNATFTALSFYLHSHGKEFTPCIDQMTPKQGERFKQ